MRNAKKKANANALHSRESFHIRSADSDKDPPWGRWEEITSIDVHKVRPAQVPRSIAALSQVQTFFLQGSCFVPDQTHRL